MKFNDLLSSSKLNPQEVLVFRHRPTEPELNKVLPWLAAERPDVFNAYQQTQGQTVEKAMGTAGYVASFIGHQPRKALFVGLYQIGKSRPLTYEQFWKVPAYVEMKAFGIRGYTEQERRERSTVLWFDLSLKDFYKEWKGKLVVDWPPPERAWWRWADRNDITVHAVLEESAFDHSMPNWDQISIDWQQLAVIPSKWRAALSQWRGIYYIFDKTDGKGYVGSACGESNLLGRWQGYAASGHGGNKLLRKRDPQQFIFSILQRVSPDMEPADVIRLESTWKERLHTRSPRGLNEN